MFKFYKNLQPGTKFVIAETARVCACIAGVIVVQGVIEKTATKLLTPSPATPYEM